MMQGNPLTFSWPVVFLLCCLTRHAHCEDSALRRFQGTWKVVKCIENGIAKPEENESLMTIEDANIAGEMFFRNRKATEIWTASLIVNSREGKDSLDVLLTCRVIESSGGMRLTYTLMPGIYSLRGDELAICIRGDGEQRPTVLDGKKGQTLWTFSRVKK